MAKLTGMSGGVAPTVAVGAAVRPPEAIAAPILPGVSEATISPDLTASEADLSAALTVLYAARDEVDGTFGANHDGNVSRPSAAPLPLAQACFRLLKKLIS